MNYPKVKFQEEFDRWVNHLTTLGEKKDFYSLHKFIEEERASRLYPRNKDACEYLNELAKNALKDEGLDKETGFDTTKVSTFLTKKRRDKGCDYAEICRLSGVQYAPVRNFFTAPDGSVRTMHMIKKVLIDTGLMSMDAFRAFIESDPFLTVVYWDTLNPDGPLLGSVLKQMRRDRGLTQIMFSPPYNTDKATIINQPELVRVETRPYCHGERIFKYMTVMGVTPKDVSIELKQKREASKGETIGNFLRKTRESAGYETVEDYAKAFDYKHIQKLKALESRNEIPTLGVLDRYVRDCHLDIIEMKKACGIPEDKYEKMLVGSQNTEYELKSRKNKTVPLSTLLNRLQKKPVIKTKYGEIDGRLLALWIRCFVFASQESDFYSVYKSIQEKKTFDEAYPGIKKYDGLVTQSLSWGTGVTFAGLHYSVKTCEELQASNIARREEIAADICQNTKADVMPLLIAISAETGDYTQKKTDTDNFDDMIYEYMGIYFEGKVISYAEIKRVVNEFLEKGKTEKDLAKEIKDFQTMKISNL